MVEVSLQVMEPVGLALLLSRRLVGLAAQITRKGILMPHKPKHKEEDRGGRRKSNPEEPKRGNLERDMVKIEVPAPRPKRVSKRRKR